MKRISRKDYSRGERGIALFMVMTTLAVLAVLIAELTYSTHVNSRLAYNFTDGLKSYYTAKAGFKFALVRINLYQQVKNFLNDPKNSQMAAFVDKSLIENIWAFPFMYPLEVPEGATMPQRDAIEAFTKESMLNGSFQLTVASESAKINVNNLLATSPEPAPSPAASPSTRRNNQPAPAQSPNPTASPAATEFEFKPFLEEHINTLLNARKETDRDFMDNYQNVTGKDIVDALMLYMKPDPQNPPRPNLPGAQDIIPKNAPLYSLNELHLIPGLDDTLIDLISPNLTVYTASGMNINKATKSVIWGLVPQMTEEEVNEVMRLRDDPDEGKLYSKEDDFWEVIKKTSAASQIDSIKQKLQKAGIRLVTNEQTFKITVQARMGMSTKTLEALVVYGPRRNTSNAQQQNQQGQQPGAQPAGQQQPGQTPQAAGQNPSGNNQNALNLVYWRMI